MEPRMGKFDVRRLKEIAGDVSGKVVDATGTTWQHVAETTGKVHEGAKHGVGQAAVKIAAVKADLMERLPGRHRNGVDLSALDDAAKLLYCRLLVRLAVADGVLDPREIANLYLFASTIALDSGARSELRLDITRAGRDVTGDAEGAQVAWELAEALRSALNPDEVEVVFTSLIRDLLRVSRADLEPSAVERERIVLIAEVVFTDSADALVTATEELIIAEERFAAGEISAGQLEKTTKDIIAKAAAFGAPIAAVSLLGSVTGLSAAGITSGLAVLGFGGVLGLSSMVTGIGVAVLLGVGVFVGARYLLGFNEREREKRREYLIQQVIANHQQAMAELSDDIAGVARKVEEALTSTTRNEERLAALRGELDAFQQALATLTDSRDAFESEEAASAE